MSESPTPVPSSDEPESASFTDPPGSGAGGIGRRKFLLGAGAVVAAGMGGKLLYDHFEGFHSADVFIGKAESYDVDLSQVVRSGLTELGIDREWIKGKSVLLKPNLVEPSREAPHINTHPAVIRAVAEVFRSWDAREVFVAEGQGHCRDSYLVLDQSSVGPMLEEANLEFVDLNHDDVYSLSNRLRLTGLTSLHLPSTLKRADIIVSLPKLKTHHWAGVTLSMKNLFGIMPGICYGWPKNVLHRVGIPQSILDINATVRPHLAIIDGIVGMEGDGPIMGTPKHAGVLIMGTSFPAVDATATRLMGLQPERIPYLAYASGRLGPITERQITQRGETVASMAQSFQLLDHPAFQQFKR